MPSEIARRVARRHHAAVVLWDVPPKTRVEYSDAGTISAVALMKMLSPTTGPLVKLALSTLARQRSERCRVGGPR